MITKYMRMEYRADTGLKSIQIHYFKPSFIFKIRFVNRRIFYSKLKKLKLNHIDI